MLQYLSGSLLFRVRSPVAEEVHLLLQPTYSLRTSDNPLKTFRKPVFGLSNDIVPN